MKSGEVVFREALELWGNEGEAAVIKFLLDHFEEVLHQAVVDGSLRDSLPDWKAILQDAVALAAKEGVEFAELDGQFQDEGTKYYVFNGDQENPDPDNVYDMIKDKELGL